MTENQETEDAIKLEALRAAAQLGEESFERGEFKTFSNGAELAAYLDALVAEVLAGKHD